MNSREFKAKILPHYTSMYRVAASVMRSDDEAADIVQDAMLDSLKKEISSKISSIPNHIASMLYAMPVLINCEAKNNTFRQTRSLILIQPKTFIPN